jgi:hypothetical protein
MNTKSPFLSHSFSDAERVWLEAAAGERPFDARSARARLHDRLPFDFNPGEIDSRFYRDDKLTILGVRLFRPSDPILSTMDKLVLRVREAVLADPKIDSLSVPNLVNLTGETERLLRPAISFLFELGRFFSGTSSNSSAQIDRVWFAGASGYDAILRYRDLDAVMQSWYERADPNRQFPFLLPTMSNRASPSVSAKNALPIKRDTAFVLMSIDPARPELEDTLNAIKEACAQFSIRAYRADEIEHQDRITKVVLDEIESCEHLIADLSDERPNVYYEVGYAHALNKRPILYRKAGTRLHFDLSVHNAPEYRNATDLREQLRRRLEAILGRGPSAA